MPALEWRILDGAKTYADVAAAVADANKSNSTSSGKSTQAWRLPTLPEVTAAIEDGGAAAGGIRFNFTSSASSCWTESGKGFDLANNKLGEDFPADASLSVAVTREVNVGPAAPTKKRLVVSGYMDTATFQQCVEAADYLNKTYSDEYTIEITREFAFEFEKKRSTMIKEGKEGVEANTRVLVTNQDNGSMESGESFISTICASTDFKVFHVDDSDENSYFSIAQRSFTKFLRSKDSEFCWIMVRLGDQLAGRIVFQLYTGLCPRTSENFIHLCKGDLPDASVQDPKDPGAEPQKVKLSYKGSSFFRVVNGGWIQAGDITSQTAGGNKGHSIYGPRFPDECFTVKHDQEGILGMANEGEHTNNSQFYVTLAKASWMDRRYVAFGRVVEGLDVMRKLGSVPTRHNQTPMEKITIEECGHMQLV